MHPWSFDGAIKNPLGFISRMVFLFLAISSTALASPYSVTLAWDPNPEPDVTGYRLLYGTSSGVRPHMVDVGNVTTATLTLTESDTIYVVAVAYNSAALESPPSEELMVPLVEEDAEIPVILEQPADVVTVPDSAQGTSAVVTWREPVFSDASTFTVGSTHSPGSVFPAGTTVVTYTAEDAAGNVAGFDFTVTVAGIQVWRQQEFGNLVSNALVSGDTVNGDGDRWSNLGEYALGLQAGQNDGHDILINTIDGDTLNLEFHHNPYLPDVLLRIEQSTDLSKAWTTLATRQLDGSWTSTAPGLEMSSERIEDSQKVTVRENIGGKTAGFYRLVVERP